MQVKLEDDISAEFNFKNRNYHTFYVVTVAKQMRSGKT